MNFLRDTCLIFPLNSEILKQCRPFSCGEKDLDNFFFCDADNYERQLLGKSYCFRLENDKSVIVCAFTLSNSSIDARNLPNSRYLTVDAYNNETTGRFYEANGFKYLFSSEQQEKEYIGMPDDRELKTRLMYFDLILT